MDFSGASTAIMIAIAAVLWFIFIVPVWAKRQDGRDARAARRAASASQASADSIADSASPVRRSAVPAPPAVSPAPAAAVTAPAPAAPLMSPQRRARARRSRLVATLLLVAAAAAVLVQAWLVVTTGPSAGAWIVVASSVVAGTLALAVLANLKARPAAAASAPVRRVSRSAADVRIESAEPVHRAEWVPTPLPQPLYLRDGEAVPSSAPLDHAELLRAAAAEAERSLREAGQTPAVASVSGAAGSGVAAAVSESPAAAVSGAAAPAARVASALAEQEAVSRYARMGMIDESLIAPVDLDEALRRRRAV